MTIRQSIRKWPWLNLLCSLLSGFAALLVLLGSQPSSPVARGHVKGALTEWLVPAALFAVCLLVPISSVILVRGYSSERRYFMGLDLQNFPGGRHSLETTFPRRAAIMSTFLLGLAWYYAQANFFSSSTSPSEFPVHVIQGLGGLIIDFALLQWTYKYLFRKAALRAGVSTAPVIGVGVHDPDRVQLVLADGSTRMLGLLAVQDWPREGIGSKSIALVLFVGLDGTTYLVTKDGECFRKLP